MQTTLLTRSLRAALALTALLALPAIRAGSAPVSEATPLAMAATGPAGNVPAGLPTHVMLGLANDPSSISWMTGSGAPWDARYQYLSAGVNTGYGWATWNSPAGAFALYYMQDSAAHGYLPVFSYYQLLQSNPASGSSEADKDYNNLNNAATMKAYYADFKLLMDQAHAFGKPVIVQIEPDFWGYMEQKAGSCGQASCVSASVASSGYADVSAYPNTVQGFAEALLHLRDTYAPNVIMAIHASCWGSTFDVCNYPSSLSDTATHAAQDAAFLASAGMVGNQAGTSSWDLVFTDTSDRDAGFYQYVEGNSHMWWDPTNAALPDFANFRTYVAGINAGTGRRVVLWQIPLGNQYFKAENNSDGHYQDNRAQYFLGDGPGYGHLSDFANAGVIGLLFGAGASGPTTYTDAKGDGVTNPAPVTSFQCNQCNTHTAQYSDDDGGYMRLFGGGYLSTGGVPIPGAGTMPTPTATTTATPAPPTATPVPPTATPVRPSPTATSAPSLNMTVTKALAGPAAIAPGATERYTITVTSNQTLSNELVDFEVYNAAGTRYWQGWYSPVSLSAGVPKTFTAHETTSSKTPAGTYTLKVGVFTSNWGYQAWEDNAATFTVAPGGARPHIAASHARRAATGHGHHHARGGLPSRSSIFTHEAPAPFGRRV